MQTRKLLKKEIMEKRKKNAKVLKTNESKALIQH